MNAKFPAKRVLPLPANGDASSLKHRRRQEPTSKSSSQTSSAPLDIKRRFRRRVYKHMDICLRAVCTAAARRRSRAIVSSSKMQPYSYLRLVLPDQDSSSGLGYSIFLRVSPRSIRHAVDFDVCFEAPFHCSVSIYPLHRSLSLPLLSSPRVGCSLLALHLRR